MRITEEQLRRADAALEGYCPRCDDLTIELCEPDAAGRKCHACGAVEGMGAIDALTAGHIEFTEEASNA